MSFPSGISPSGSYSRSAVVACLAAAIVACEGPARPADSSPVATVELSQPAILLTVGSEQQLSATLKSAEGVVLHGRAVDWVSDDTTVAGIAASGRLIARSAGATRVVASSEGKSAAAQVTVTNPVPSATSLSPSSVAAGAAGFTMTIAGSAFAADASVRIGASTRFPINSTRTQIRVEVPASEIAQAGGVDVVVVNPGPGGGASAALTLTVTAVPGNPVPHPGILAPSWVAAGGADFSLAVIGSGFVETSVVSWNGEHRPTTWVSDAELRASIRASDIAAVGRYQVRVVNPAPGGGTSEPLAFDVAVGQPGNPRPVISSLLPGVINFGSPATEVDVYGSGFVAASKARVNGNDRPTQFLGSGMLRVTLFASDLAVPRALALTISSPAPGGGVSDPHFLYVRRCCYNIVYDGEVDGRRELLMLPVAGNSIWTDPVRLLPDVTARHPSPSPDGSRIAFVGQDDVGNVDIYILTVATRQVRRVTSDLSVDDQPAWSPDGTRIAYRSMASGRGEIVIATQIGSDDLPWWHFTRVSPPGADESAPDWSPNGSRIAFASDVGGTRAIYTMKPDGSDRRRVITASDLEGQPSWSPDGLVIAYVGVGPAGQAKIKLAASGEGPIHVYPSELADGVHPMFSPAGGTIAFVSGGSDPRHITTMRIDGTDVHSFSFGAPFGRASNPNWIRVR